MAEPGDNSCQSYFDCGDEKTRNLSLQQIIMKAMGKTAAGCAALRVIASISGSFTASSTGRTSTRTANAVVGSHTIPAGTRNAYIETSSDFVGTILGAAADPSRVYSWDRTQNDDYNNAIAYTITSGSVVVGQTV